MTTQGFSRGSRLRFLAATGAALLVLGSICPAAGESPGMAPAAEASAPSVDVLLGGLKAAVNAQVAAARRVSRALGVHVVDVASGREVFSFNAETPRILASNTKLFTTAAALDHLGPGFFFETPILVKGLAEGGVLRGELAVLGVGDPNISGRNHQGDPYAIFRGWAAALRAQGIERVEGDVYLVHGFFDGPRIHPDWPEDQLDRWYEAPVEALSFNDNCVLVLVWPGAVAGAPARVETVPPLGIFEVESTATTTASRHRHWVKIERRLGTNVIEVAGAIYGRGQPAEKWVTVEDPVQFFGAALKDALALEGVELAGKLYRASGLPDPRGPWKPLAVHRSDLLSTLEVINKRSQNFYAESVLKGLGARSCGSGDWQGGLDAVHGFLAGAGLGATFLADGSGMSRGNRGTPEQLTALLRYMYFHPWGREFLSTLPASGEVDLKWQERLADPPYLGNVHAKTGTLSGVSTLSGYARATSGRLYAFSILCNANRSNWEAVLAQDRIVRALIDAG